MKVSEYIRDLLISNNRVVVSGFGVFETEEKPAQITEDRIIPPTKEVKFIDDKQVKDNKLTEFIAKGEGITIEQADKLLDDFVKTAYAKIKISNNVLIEGVGILSKNSSGDIVFKQIERESLSADNYGFSFAVLPETVDKKPSKRKRKNNKKTDKRKTKQNKKKAAINDTKEEKIPVKSGKMPVLLKIFVWIIVISIFAVPAYLYRTQISDFLKPYLQPLFVNTDTTITQDTSDSVKSDTESNNSIAEEYSSTVDSVNDTEATIKEADFANVTPISLGKKFKKYYLIVGSFSTRKNAEKLVGKLKSYGYKPEILASENGRFRVALNGGFDDIEKAVATYKAFKFSHDKYDVWLLRNE